jgi:hypothetical protein
MASRHDGKRRWPSWVNAAALLVSSWIILTWSAVRLGPDADVAAAAFPPWWGLQRASIAAASADSEIIRAGFVPTILVVRLAKADGRARLRAAGAWALIDPRAVGGCIEK